jgi:nickel-dependent lactate racemase
MIDVALTRKREIAAVFAGNAEAAHRAGTDFVGRTMLETIDAPADAVITTAAGYPLDLTFYQTVKGITAASHVVQDGGRILVLSECAEGAGAPEFQDMMRRFPDGQAFLDFIAGAPVTVDQWQLEKLALVSTRKQILYHTPGLPAEFRGGLWGRYMHSFEEGVTALLDGLRPGARVIVIPEGPYVLARVQEPVAA